jgi:hypothetical protein
MPTAPSGGTLRPWLPGFCGGDRATRVRRGPIRAGEALDAGSVGPTQSTASPPLWSTPSTLSSLCLLVTGRACSHLVGGAADQEASNAAPRATVPREAEPQSEAEAQTDPVAREGPVPSVQPGGCAASLGASGQLGPRTVTGTCVGPKQSGSRCLMGPHAHTEAAPAISGLT